jgi:hypothetical protein
MNDPPKLGGGLTPVQWLRMGAKMDRKRQAFARAREAEAIADWVESITCGNPK